MASLYRTIESKIISFDKVEELARGLRTKSIVTTNGCFDILHQGHITYLEKAKQLGDVLVCGVNSDESVRRLEKGDDRPVFPESIRARQVAALESVDYVVVFEQDTPEELIRRVQPRTHVKGADYQGRRIPEQDILDEIGAKLELLPLVEGFSTTSILKKIKTQSI